MKNHLLVGLMAFCCSCASARTSIDMRPTKALLCKTAIADKEISNVLGKSVELVLTSQESGYALELPGMRKSMTYVVVGRPQGWRPSPETDGLLIFLECVNDKIKLVGTVDFHAEDWKKLFVGYFEEHQVVQLAFSEATDVLTLVRWDGEKFVDKFQVGE